ncbi:WD repeat-containing protein, putative [Plasmodium ovale curtisi]|uniref:WD repeat-containing protein, putative n=1 Tax=Plasmodium ovale curtisi TaxID=864141 RepID=A0A1A8WUB3_PLAOA|nr:WD repeat-containing protein, putative [Plasmodium ovale curtisi]
MLNSHVESININIVEKLQNEGILSKSSKKCFKKYKKLLKNRNKKGSINGEEIKENREADENSEMENDKPTNSETEEQTKITVINKKRKEKNEKDKERELSLKELIHSITFYEKLKTGNKLNSKSEENSSTSLSASPTIKTVCKCKKSILRGEKNQKKNRKNFENAMYEKVEHEKKSMNSITQQGGNSMNTIKKQLCV